MLTPEESRAIDHEIAIEEEPDYRRSACLEALRVVQRHRGWVDDEALRDVAEYLA
jgi:NADH-quinone oxidoreductase subunit E